MKILHVIATLNHGGTEVTCRDICSELRRNFQCTNIIVALNNGTGSIADELAATAGCDVATTPAAFGRLRRAIWFWQKCRFHKPDGVIFHLFGIDHVVLGLACRLAGVQRLSVKAGNPPVQDQVRASFKVKMKWILRLSRWLRMPVIAASDHIFQTWKALAPLPLRSCVIHNGCDYERIRLGAKRSRELRKDSFNRIGMISRLDPIKDHTTLIRAFSLLAENKKWRLRIIGDGVLRPALEHLCNTLAISGQVEWAGTRKDIPEQLGEIDVFVLATTNDEGFGIVLIEALAAGVPVVASDIPACREVLQHGLFGVLVKQGDPEALAKAMREVIEQPGYVQDVSRDSQPFYGIQRTADAHLRVLRGG